MNIWGKYTKEKVLYFASRDQGLNVSVDEGKHTDLHQLVDNLLHDGMITLVAEDDCDRYYKLTKLGRIQYLKNHITYNEFNDRESHNAKHREEIARLEKEIEENEQRKGT